MRLHAATHAATTVDPIRWLFLEQRGPMTAHAGRYEQTTLEMWADNDGRAALTDGRMTYGGDPGTAEFVYESLPWMVRDGVDPEAATEAARRGAALLAETMERAAASLAQFAVTPGSRPSRDPEQLDIWLRHASGAKARYLVPVDRAPQGLLDAQAAALAFARLMRDSYERQDPR